MGGRKGKTSREEEKKWRKEKEGKIKTTKKVQMITITIDQNPYLPVMPLINDMIPPFGGSGHACPFVTHM